MAIRVYEGAGSIEEAPRVYAKQLRWIIVALVVLFVGVIIIRETLWFWLNIIEFSELYILPIYFEITGGLVLAALALVRIDFKNRRSIFWWSVRLSLKLIKERGVLDYVPADYLNFKGFKLSPGKFLIWQVTKLLIGALVFLDLMFGMALLSMSRGWDSGLGGIWGLFALPFITPPFDLSYAQTRVAPLAPSLTLIIPSVFRAITIRLIVLVGITQLAKLITLIPSSESRYQWPRIPVALIEALVALGLSWTTFNAFFPDYIDYNTRYVVGGLASASILFIVLTFIDGVRRRRFSLPLRRSLALRVGAVFLIALLTGSIMVVNNSIADAKKIEWRGPYTTQQIAVNRYLAQLDEVKEMPYNFSVSVVPLQEVSSYVEGNRELLQKVRLWDWGAAFAKLKPEIGLIPYIDFQDSDIIRFNKTLYWSASMKPILPKTVQPADRWYAEHLVYTHVPIGFLLLEGNKGEIVGTERFFKQRRIYYGEAGLLNAVWAAYPVGRTRSDEIGGFFYDGKGGISLPPPLSWLFEFNFFLAFRDQTIHALRYRDVYQRMNILFPYFEYEFEGRGVDMYPVTDGEKTYWLMPLIVKLNTNHVPWSNGNWFMRLVGYALIDIYNGDTQLLILGEDYFSDLFKRVYSKYITEGVPEWLKKQFRYPEELFEWRVAMYNFYHVTDPATYIVAKEFFEVPKGLDTYYIIGKPPTVEEPEFIGILSLELKGAGGRNLAGYMIVRNDYPHLGELLFYKVPLESEVKLLGPTAVLEALEKNPEFAKLKTLLREPRIGDTILMRIGEHDVYFIPVYTAGAGGVVTQTGVVAAVGATFTGKYYVGLDLEGTAEGAFKAFLADLGGVKKVPAVAKVKPEVGLEARRVKILEYLRGLGFPVATPVTINPDVAYMEGNVSYVSEDQWSSVKSRIEGFSSQWGPEGKKILYLTMDSQVKIGVLVNVGGIVELHFISILLE